MSTPPPTPPRARCSGGGSPPCWKRSACPASDPGDPAPARSRPGRQGLHLESDSKLAPPQAHHPHDPRAGLPGPARQPGRRPPAFDREAYKHRNVVERCFNRLKQWRAIATRYGKTAQSFEAAVALAPHLMWA